MKDRGKLYLFGLSLALSALTAANYGLRASAQSSAQSVAGGPVLPVGKTIQIKAPLGLPPVPIPADNPPTEDTIALGRRLYYDPQLSVDGTISCASCMRRSLPFPMNTRSRSAWQKDRHSPRPHGNQFRLQHSAILGWPCPSLEEQARDRWPTRSKWRTRLDGVVKRVQADPKYLALFQKAWVRSGSTST